MTEIENAPDWNCLPGVTLDGGYELKEIVEADRDQVTLRVRVLGDYTLKAAALFWPLESPSARRQVEHWQSLKAFQRRDDLRAPLAAGVLTLNGSATAYVVVQEADETLADAIEKRPLSQEEATDMLRAVARGLEELHSNGLVHGCTAPSEILAMGDSVKLTTEPIREVNSEPLLQRKVAKYLAPESDKNNVTMASDVWCLGATLFESLTQRAYDQTLREEAVGIKHPLGTVLDACLETDPDRRCKLSGLEPILRSKAPPFRPKVTPQPVLPQITEIQKSCLLKYPPIYLLAQQQRALDLPLPFPRPSSAKSSDRSKVLELFRSPRIPQQTWDVPTIQTGRLNSSRRRMRSGEAEPTSYLDARTGMWIKRRRSQFRLQASAAGSTR